MIKEIAEVYAQVDPSQVSELNPDDFRAVQSGLQKIYMANGLNPDGSAANAQNAVVYGGIAQLLFEGRIAYNASPGDYGSSAWEVNGRASSFIFLHYSWRYGGRRHSTLVEEWYHIQYQTADDYPNVRPACVRLLGSC